ncbi:MAG: hypothetical protein IH621_18335 [Krumholzibacteria bacterium]|nr:hypothetical protein [Candidatus Krumholzibacteria bacterium]
MHDRIIVIIATAEAAKARTGAMYALNAMKHGWLADVKLVLFGPAELLFLDDPEFQDLVIQFMHVAKTPLACRYLSDRQGSSERLRDLGLDVQFVGAPISEAIREGYLPMVW